MWRCRVSPARLVPVAVGRVLEHFKQNRLEGESFRAYVLRHKVETFRQLTADPHEAAHGTSPRCSATGGDDIEYSLKLGRGECAA